MNVCRVLLVGTVVGAGLLSTAGAQTPDEIQDFESKIRPVLVAHCYACHSAQSGKAEGGLRVDSRDAIRTGGDSGPAVVPGDPEASLLLTAMSHADPDLAMPLDKPALSPATVADFERWIRRGAPDPRATDLVKRPPNDIESGRRFWSYRPPRRVALPVTHDPAWARRPFDNLVLARLEAERLTPSPDADPATLLRRLSFDLVGLPPEPHDLDAFRIAAAHDLDAAIASVVDRLLASPRFGERWGKHWLDVARFAESSGKESNVTFPHAWRYRDYVIDAFNADVPFDQFIVEQLAGDLLPHKDESHRARMMVATGFLALGPKSLNEMNREQFAADVVDEQIDTVSRALLASSIACARCHDHKFDPFEMVDYYALAGIFSSTSVYFGTSIGTQNNIGGDLLRLPDLPDQLVPNKSMSARQVARLKDQLAGLNKEEADRRAAAELARKEGKNPAEAFSLKDALRILWTRGGVEGRLKTVDDSGRALPLCMGVAERETIADARLLERGEVAHPTDPVSRRFPRVFAVDDVPPPGAEQSGRLQLAHWIAHPQHPLTARVFVNRAWRHLTGAGIVRTVDNFGFTGERPSHPALLDHLAMVFVDSGWSVKTVVREIVLSRTYRQSSMYRADCFQIDPDNRLLWRAPKRRLDAEAIRDAMLAVSGELDVSRRPGSLIAEIGDRSVSLFGFAKNIPADLDGSLRRSVYLPVVRDRLPDVLDLFDAADPSFVTGDRTTTNVPLQALYLMNSPFVQARADALAHRVLTEAGESTARIERAFVLCFGRVADAAEVERVRQYVGTTPRDEQWALVCQALLATAEFRNLD